MPPPCEWMILFCLVRDYLFSLTEKSGTLCYYTQMLESITIKNFGIIEAATLDLSKGLNILTGETGAGKSILVDALRLCLGDRFQASHLRDGADTCTVEAVFSLTPAFLKTLPGWEDLKSDDNALVIQRSVTSDGKNRIRVNGLTATVTQLKAIGDSLVDLHGPHDHQQLLAEEQHLRIIDALTTHGKTLTDYTALYKRYTAARAQIDALHTLARSRERDLDLLAHQIKELEQVPLTKEDHDEVEQGRVKINNAEKLYENITQTLAVLENEDASVELLLSRAFKPLQKLTTIDERSSSLLDDLAALQDNARAMIAGLHDYADALSFDPGYAKAVNDKSDAYDAILRKYGPALDDARRFYTDAKEKFALLSDVEQNEALLQEELNEAESGLRELGKAIARNRKKTADLLKKTIEKELTELGFKSVTFEARLNKKDIAADGIDHAVFFISTNAGESLKPLAEIVSSGEAARLMLAVKRALMKVDPVPVLIFDEIDAQIGGRLGTVIGLKLKEISQHRQVILITHLPQIAAFADAHFRISKNVDKGRTRTMVCALDKKARIEELAQMMSGETMTPVSLKHAKDMLDNAKKASE